MPWGRETESFHKGWEEAEILGEPVRHMGKPTGATNSSPEESHVSYNPSDKKGK